MTSRSRDSAAWSRWFTPQTAILWCVLALTAVVYLSLGNGFILDDVVMIVKNPDLGSWSFLWKGFTRNEFWYTDAGFLQSYQFRNYRPLLLVFYWIDYHLFGLSPGPWHASVVAVHLLTAWLVFKIAQRLAGDSTAALIAASAFALTPVHVAAVVWMAGSGFVLAGAFELAALYLIMPRAKGTVRNWAVAMALFAGALLCHESAAAFPGLVACYAFVFDDDVSTEVEEVVWNRGSLWMRTRRAVIWQAPFAVELLIYMVTRRLVLGFFVNNPYYFVNLLSDAQAVFTIPLVLAGYLIDLAMPWLTLPNHRVFPVSSPLSPEFWVPLAAIALLVAAFLVVVRRSPRRRLYLFCAAWIAVTLAPMVALRSMPHLVQDYYLYLPSVGWCILVGDLLVVVARKNTLARRLAFGGAAAMLVVYAIALWKVERFWRNDVAAARAYVQGFPESVIWHWTLATYLDKAGDSVGAENEITTALRMEPDRTGLVHPHSSELHHYLGELLARRGDIDGAVLEFGRSVDDPPDEDEQHPSRPPLEYCHDAASLYYMGLDDAKARHNNKAIRELTKALAAMESVPVPDYGLLAMSYIKLAELYDKEGNQEQVESVLKKVDSMSAGELAVGLARAKIRLNHDDKDGAERMLRELSQRYTGNGQVSSMLGDLEFQLKHYKEALDCYQQAGAGWYADSQLHLSMAQSLHGLGRQREALDQCRLAEALDPHNLKVKFSCSEIETN